MVRTVSASMAAIGQSLAVVLTALPLAVLWPTLEGLVASSAWITFIVITRIVSRGKPRTDRLRTDMLAITACAIGFFLGGLYWLPAVIVFAWSDRRDHGAMPTERLPRGGRGTSLGLLGALATGAGLTGIALFLFLPTYSVAQSAPASVGTQSVDMQRSATAFEAALGAGGAAAVAIVGALFIAVGVGAFAASRGGRIGRSVLAIAGIAVSVISLLGILTIGPFLVPGVILTLVTLWVAFTQRTPDMGSSEPKEAGVAGA